MDGKTNETVNSHPELAQRYIFIDTETTGLDPEKNDVIEVAAIVFEEDDNNEPQEIARYHGRWGITNGVVDIEALHVNGRRATDDVFSTVDHEYRVALINGLADFFATYITDKTFILGGSVFFDIDFVNALFKKYGLDSERILSKRKAIDIQHVAKFLNDAAIIEVPNYRMATLVKALLGQDWTHGAMSDAKHSSELYFTMRKMV